MANKVKPEQEASTDDMPLETHPVGDGGSYLFTDEPTKELVKKGKKMERGEQDPEGFITDDRQPLTGNAILP